MKKTDIFERLDNVIGNHMEGIASDEDLINIAYEINKYLRFNPHHHDIIDEMQESFNDKCPICGSQAVGTTSEYEECFECGHEWNN